MEKSRKDYDYSWSGSSAIRDTSGITTLFEGSADYYHGGKYFQSVCRQFDNEFKPVAFPQSWRTNTGVSRFDYSQRRAGGFKSPHRVPAKGKRHKMLEDRER